MENRLKIAREATDKSVQGLASALDISEDAYFRLEGGETMSDEILKKLSALFKVDEKYFLDYDYELTIFPSWYKVQYGEADSDHRWHPSREEDCKSSLHRPYWECRLGAPIYTKKKEKPAYSGELPQGTVIYHRDGKTVTKHFSKEQIDMIHDLPEHNK